MKKCDKFVCVANLNGECVNNECRGELIQRPRLLNILLAEIHRIFFVAVTISYRPHCVEKFVLRRGELRDEAGLRDRNLKYLEDKQK